MAESWKEACWKAEREVEEYKGTIVPALVEKVRELEEQLRKAERMNERQSIVMGKMHDEVCFMRQLIHRHGLESALASEWERERKNK
jgi:hypothetical protein